MDNDTAISVRGLGKAFRLGLAEERQDTLFGSISHTLKAPLRNFKNLKSLDTSKAGDEDGILWALRDVSFDVKKGEVLGIIGRNGAGKSTLLKVLSKITEPTHGEIRMRGRVSSLLEVGTGFHPELTGRENIYMNGTILGMRKSEIDRKFDEIVDFSGVERFLDTPIKRYSSGQKVRLAFSVAAHLEPEILIVDEVLAVGDHEFQAKCLGKMKQIAGGERTVLFVSHNMAAVEGLCSRAILLESGELLHDESPQSVIREYISSTGPGVDGLIDYRSRYNKYSDKKYIEKIEFTDGSESRRTYLMGDPVSIKICVAGIGEDPSLQVGIVFKSMTGEWLAMHNTGMTAVQNPIGDGVFQYSFRCESLPLVPGRYLIDVSVANKASGRVDAVEDALSIDIIESDVYGSGYRITSSDGVFYLQGEWAVALEDAMKII